MTNNLFQTIIYEAINIDSFKKNISGLKNSLDNSGNLFIIANNVYVDNVIESSFFDFIEVSLKTNLKYINIIVFPIESLKHKLKHNIKYLLWFVKDYNAMYFDKDTIREKHIWKDVEWGKRTKNYNEKGKDPSNIWIPTIDNGKGKITKHLIMPIEEIINRCIISTTKKHANILIEISKKIDTNKLIKNRNIQVIPLTENDNSFCDLDISIHKINNSFTGAKIYFKSSESMQEIENNTVNLMVTSPPYWNLKNYFKEGQIGQESYNEYLNRLNAVWRETYRILMKNGSMWININTRTKNKKPILIPNDIIKECKKIGFKLKDIIIWHKSSGIPTHKNNLVDKYEYFLWFVKDNKHYFNLDNIKEINDYQNEKINNGIIWNINRKAGSVGKDFIHPAIYPTKLIERVIKLTTKKNDIVMDPFLGSGTSMLAALKNQRNFIGYEYNENFDNLIKYRASDEKLNTDNIKLHYFNKKIEKDQKIFRK